METKQPEKEYILSRENLFQSVLSDLFTWGMFFVMLTVNYRFWKGEWIVTIFLIGMWWMWLFMRASKIKKFNSKKELIDYLEKQS